MINQVTNFAKYRDSQSGVEEISSKDDLNEFQKELFQNWNSNFLIAKGRQQTVSTSLAWLAYYRAAYLNQDVAIKTIQKDYFKSYSNRIFLCSKSEIQRFNAKEIIFKDSGKVVSISNFEDYEGKTFHSVFIDETISPVRKEIEKAKHTMPSQIIAAVTVRQKNNYKNEKYMQNLNQLLWTLKEYQDYFKYIEAWDEDTLLSDKDIRTYRTMLK